MILQRTYYFIELENFDIPEEGFKTEQQLTIQETKINPDPVSYLFEVTKDYYKGWSKLVGQHEILDRKPRRIAGDPEYHLQSILGGHETFDVFYNKKLKILIFNCSKQQKNGLIRRLLKNFPSMISVKTGQVNFPYLLDQLQNTKIVGSWFSDLKGQVTAVGLFGDRVNLDQLFDHYQAVGTMSALTLEVNIEDQKEPCKIMVTKERGIIIYEKWNQKQDLDFLFNIRPILFKTN